MNDTTEARQHRVGDVWLLDEQRELVGFWIPEGDTWPRFALYRTPDMAEGRHRMCALLKWDAWTAGAEVVVKGAGRLAPWLVTDRYFSFSGEDYDTHRTEKEARDACGRALDDYRADAGEGWCEDVQRIAWGPITERIVETLRVEHLPECVTESGRHECDVDCRVGGDWDGRTDYGLVEVTP